MTTYEARAVVMRLLGDESDRRYRIARAGNRVVSKGLASLRKATGRRLQIDVGAHTMIVPEDMRWAYRNGVYYERSLASWLEKLAAVAPRPVMYDVGANCGYYVLRMAPYFGEIHAFEPVSTTRGILRENIARNDLKTVEIHSIGLSDREATAEIRLFSSSGNNSIFDVLPGDGRVHQIGTQDIRLSSIDILVNKGIIPPPGLVKIDVEGAELFVLRGARSVIRDYEPIFTLEFQPSHFEKAGYRGSDVIDELQEYGYVVYGVPDDPSDSLLYTVAELEPTRVSNLIAVSSGVAAQLQANAN